MRDSVMDRTQLDKQTKEQETVVEVIREYPFQGAGKTWIIKNVELTKTIDGSTVLTGHEIQKIHRTVANELCSTIEPLTAQELDYLCTITLTQFKDVAHFLGVTKSAVSLWKKPNKVVPLGDSLRLKRWFWFKVFKDIVQNTLPQVGIDVLANDEHILEVLSQLGRKLNKAG